MTGIVSTDLKFSRAPGLALAAIPKSMTDDTNVLFYRLYLALADRDWPEAKGLIDKTKEREDERLRERRRSAAGVVWTVYSTPGSNSGSLQLGSSSPASACYPIGLQADPTRNGFPGQNPRQFAS